jgi:hypothetical protein
MKAPGRSSSLKAIGRAFKGELRSSRIEAVMNILRKGWFYFLVILALITLNQLVFTYFFKISHFEWYLKNGSLIGAATVLVTFAWDVNKNAGLISANPRHYLGSHLQLIGAQLFALGAVGKNGMRKREEGAFIFVTLLDSLVFIIFALLMVVIFILWTIIVVPIQYFLILFLGGPGRIYLSSPFRTFAKFNEAKLEIHQIPREQKKSDDWMDISIARKPVSFTYALIVLVLSAVRYFM